MNSKEIQLSLAFCGALAAVLLISAPVNEKIALAGSGIACIISSGLFYGGISKYFSDKEKQTQTAEEQTKLLIENFETKLKQTQNSTNAQIKSVISNLNDNLSNSLQKPISELQNSTNAGLKEVVESIENLYDSLNGSMGATLNEVSDNLLNLSKSIKLIKIETEKISNNTNRLKDLNETFEAKLSQNQNSTNDGLKEVVESIENLDDNLNDSMGATLNEVSDNLLNLFESVKLIKIETENNSSNTNKLKDLNKTSVEILENIEDLSGSLSEVSKLNETLQELLRTMSRQEEIYQTMLNQYKSMTSKDVELIESLAKKIR